MEDNLGLTHFSSEHYYNEVKLEDDLIVNIHVFNAYEDSQNLKDGFQIVKYTFDEEDVEEGLLEFRERSEEFYDDECFAKSPFYPIVGKYGDRAEVTLHIDSGTEPEDMINAADFAEDLIKHVHEEIGL
ncbi:MAG: hypothetical protein J07AB43_07510 [Candidatus Nanosalina sp. J07AB43]|jgi:hypothetical protein|nr:MAG: hypothetical protein J07AB43_07510 [Candidatus Nanosalina sp. J07AB43]